LGIFADAKLIDSPHHPMSDRCATVPVTMPTIDRSSQMEHLMTNDIFQQDETSPFTDLLKLTQHQRDTLAKLAAEMPADPADAIERRRHTRIPIKQHTKGFIELNVNQGTSGKYIVFPIEISQGGMSFIHGSFIHSSTQCTISIPMPDGEIMAIDAVITWCRLLRGRAHEVGAKFTSLLSNEVIEAFNSPPPPKPALSTTEISNSTIDAPLTPPASPSAILPPFVLKRLLALTTALEEASSIGESIKAITKDLFNTENNAA
jgi:PilZ domain